MMGTFKTFFRPLQCKRFWKGFAFILLVPALPFIALIVLLTGYGSSADSAFAGMVAVSYFYIVPPCSLMAVIVYLLFERLNWHSLEKYALAGFIIAFIAALALWFPFRFDQLVVYSTFGAIGAAFAAYFWCIAVKPLTKEKTGD